MVIRVELAGNRILLASRTPTPGLKEAIPGAYFRKDKNWSVPLDMPTCLLLRERYGNRLVVGPLLTAWAREQIAQRERQAETASAGDAELKTLPDIAPELAAAMATRTYQRAAVRFVADSQGRDGRRRALIADTVGLGKSTEALGAILEIGQPGPYLIVCPKTAVETAWVPEIQRRLPQDETITLPEGRAARENVLDSLVRRKGASLARTWVIVHPASIRTQTWWICPSCGDKTKYKTGVVQELDCGHSANGRATEHEHVFPQLFQIPWGAVVADESDQMLIKKTATPNLQRRGMELLRDLVPEGGARIAMSGTPFRSKPHQIFSTLNWLDPKRFGSKWNFLKKFWNLGGYSGYEVGQFLEEREGMLVDELKDIMIRRTREQVRGDLPAKIYADNRRLPADDQLPEGIYLHMSREQEKAYRAMDNAAYADLEGGRVSAIGVLAELTRLKQFAGAVGSMTPEGEFRPVARGIKYEWILEHLIQLGLPDAPATKIVIASQFTQLLEAFAEGLARDLKLKPHRYGLITGNVSGPRRTEHISKFEDESTGLDILFLNTKAGGSAITLDAADEMIVIDETWVDDEQAQLEGRIDNRQPERKICARTYYYLRCYDTVEEGIAMGNAEAKRNGKRLLDGVGGAKAIGFARSVMRR